MGDIIPFRKKSPAEKHKGKTLCLNNFHKWKVESESVFDVKEGRLVTRWVCSRCGAVKTRAI